MMSNEGSSGFQPLSTNNAASGRFGNMNLKLIGLVVVAAVSVIFILQNREYTTIDFLFFEIRNRVWTAMVSAMVLGVILDRLFLRWWDKRKANKQPKS